MIYMYYFVFFTLRKETDEVSSVSVGLRLSILCRTKDGHGAENSVEVSLHALVERSSTSVCMFCVPDVLGDDVGSFA